MLGNRRRVEQDLERIRKANLPPEQAAREEEQEKELKRRLSDERIGFKDVLAMIIAIFSLVLPYFLTFAGVLGALVFMLWWFAGR